MREKTIRSAVLAVAFGAATVIGATVAIAHEVKITFLHFNDMYEIGPTDGAGGFAQLMTVLKRERAKNPNAIVTFGGAMLGPSVLSSITKGEQMIELANAIGIDVAEVGHHDFAYGPDVLKQRIAESKFPWLGANVVGADGKTPLGLKTTLIKTIDEEIKVGFLGVITPDAAFQSAAGPTIKFLPVAEAARAAVKELKDQGAHLIVALTFLLTTEDRALIAAVPEIDIVLGGRELERLATNVGTKRVPLVKTRMNGEDVVQVDAFINIHGGERSLRTAMNRFDTKNIDGDAAIMPIVNKWNDRAEKELSQPVGKVTTPLDSRRDFVRTRETAIANLFADALRAGAKAEIGILNTGGVRGDQTYDANVTFTRKDVLKEYPFGNRSVVLELKGEDLWTALENGVSDVGNRAGRFPGVSGIKFTYDQNKDPGARLVEATINGKPLDKNATYRVATLDFMYTGGDGYVDSLGKGKKLIDPADGLLLSQLIIDHIAEKGFVAPKVEGRIVEK